MEKKDFHSNYKVSSLNPNKGKVAWKSPSNLAIVKYWGKYGEQLPRNPSISITLSEATTETTVQYSFNPEQRSAEIEFYFEGEKNIPFENRITKFLSGLHKYFPFLESSSLIVHSSNSFPHSSGIASSASSMSALAICLCDIEKQLAPTSYSQGKEYFFHKASFISRLGSGSACRSVFPKFGLWGETEGDEKSSDLYAIPFEDYHPIFDTIHNDILIVSTKEKSVSSSAGHQLMETNHYADRRFEQAKNRVIELKEMLKRGDVDSFGEMLESEALTLHALMMASNPSYLLMEPKTLIVIDEIRQFRKNTGVPIYFSLDAGPNVHIISFEKDREKVGLFLSELKKHAVQGNIISDKIGEGAIKIS